MFCYKQRTAYEMRIRDWSSDVCSSDLGLFVLPVGVAGQDDVATPFEQRRQAVEGPAPHDHRAAHGELLETAQVGGQVPRHPAVGADDAVGGAGEDQRDLRAVHAGAVPTQVAWPSWRPGGTPGLPESRRGEATGARGAG